MAIEFQFVVFHILCSNVLYTFSKCSLSFPIILFKLLTISSFLPFRNLLFNYAMVVLARGLFLIQYSLTVDCSLNMCTWD